MCIRDRSVDSEHLLNAIEKEAARAGIVQNVLLEVNIGGEESKTGVAPVSYTHLDVYKRQGYGTAWPRQCRARCVRLRSKSPPG